MSLHNVDVLENIADRLIVRGAQLNWGQTLMALGYGHNAPKNGGLNTSKW